jgi:hypothetical protein
MRVIHLVQGVARMAEVVKCDGVLVVPSYFAVDDASRIDQALNFYVGLLSDEMIKVSSNVIEPALSRFMSATPT